MGPKRGPKGGPKGVRDGVPYGVLGEGIKPYLMLFINLIN
mgnify:CR=1 FL=1